MHAILAVLLTLTQPTLELKTQDELLKAEPTASQTYAQPRIAGRVLAFDGIDDHATIPGAPSLAYPGQGGWSVELWVKPIVYPTAETAILVQESINVPGHDPYSIRAYPTHFAFRVDGRHGQSDEIAFDLPLGVWSHVAAVYDADGHHHTMAVYVNGVRLDFRDTPVHMESRHDPIRLGNVGREYAQPYFTGLLDDVRIWNQALTDTEVGNAMRADLGPVQFNLVLHLTFEDTSDLSPISLDRSPYANHALLGVPTDATNPAAPRRVLRQNPDANEPHTHAGSSR
ncbi:MAG: LamG domain-containing protein [Phycisphaerales bacterium JB040]